MSMLEVKELKKSFAELEVLRNVSFSVEKGDVIAIIGSSGSGKSTLLRSLIGLERIDGGSVAIDGEYLIRDGAYAAPDTVRDMTLRMGMVFQSFNLFNNLTVKNNLIMPARRVKKIPQERAEAMCMELLAKVGLTDKADEYPSRLSGGQKQRVGIARALMLSPEIMLFDEPTSALDPQLTSEVLNVMRDLARERMTMLVVTHEMDFARDAASRVVYMDGGVIVEEGLPGDIFNNAKNEKTRRFLGLK